MSGNISIVLSWWCRNDSTIHQIHSLFWAHISIPLRTPICSLGSLPQISSWFFFEYPPITPFLKYRTEQRCILSFSHDANSSPSRKWLKFLLHAPCSMFTLKHGLELSRWYGSLDWVPQRWDGGTGPFYPSCSYHISFIGDDDDYNYDIRIAKVNWRLIAAVCLRRVKVFK